MKFVLVHFRANETDGVSLEMEKWQSALRNLGHESFTLAGKGADLNHPLLDFRNPRIKKFASNCFDKPEISPEKLNAEFKVLAAKAEKFLRFAFKKKKPGVAVVNNVFSLPINIPFAAALANLSKQFPEIEFWGFHHDFYWERSVYGPKYSLVKKWLADYFPPKIFKKHIVINSLAKRELLKRKGLKSEIFDNYFDFSAAKPLNPSAVKKELRVPEDAVIVLHATRIVERKAIEFAVDFLEKCVAELEKRAGKKLYNGKIISEKPGIYLVFPGLVEERDYYLKIKERLKHSPLKALFCEKICRKRSFWDFYGACDAVTYTSVKEGWGNQLVEALAMRKPVAVFEYPVFRSNIKKFGFKLVSLGNKFYRSGGLRKLPEKKASEAAVRFLRILLDRKKYSDITGKNHETAFKKLSIFALEKRIARFMKI